MLMRIIDSLYQSAASGREIRLANKTIQGLSEKFSLLFTPPSHVGGEQLKSFITAEAVQTFFLDSLCNHLKSNWRRFTAPCM